MNRHVRLFKKLFKDSTFDRDAETRIITAIEDTASKLVKLAHTLRRRGGPFRPDCPQCHGAGFYEATHFELDCGLKLPNNNGPQIRRCCCDRN